MSIVNVEDSLILIIDVQDRLLNAVFNEGAVEKNSFAMAKAANILDLPVFVTEQYPKGLGATIDVVKNNLPEETKYFEKIAFNALFDMNLVAALKQTKRKNVILFGIETHICVYQTALSLLENGFAVHLIKDVCGSRTLDEYVTALKCMRTDGVQVKTTEMILFELLKSAKHPRFKDIQALIK